MSLFWSFYDDAFYKTLYAPRVQLKTLALRVVGEFTPQKHIFYLEINYAEQNGYVKIWLDVFGAKNSIKQKMSKNKIK
jgi:hypothetical protein